MSPQIGVPGPCPRFSDTGWIRLLTESGGGDCLACDGAAVAAPGVAAASVVAQEPGAPPAAASGLFWPPCVALEDLRFGGRVELRGEAVVGTGAPASMDWVEFLPSISDHQLGKRRQTLSSPSSRTPDTQTVMGGMFPQAVWGR